MAVERTTRSFERVSRIRGAVFEYASLSASLSGILALYVLLVYVFVDALELSAAGPSWLAAWLAAAILPYVGFCLYSAGDRAVTRRVVLALLGGAVATFAAFAVVESLWTTIPRLDWHHGYLFAVLVPTVGYATYVGSHATVGAAGFGLLGRLLGGLGVGLALVILFDVFDERLWLLVYTLGVLPAAGLLAYAARQPESAASLLAVPVGLVGTGVAVLLAGVLPAYPASWLIFLWTFALPVGAVVAASVARDRGRRRAIGVVAVGVGVAVAGSLLAALAGLRPASALLVLVTTAVPAATYVDRTLEDERARIGLVLPLLIAGGVLLAAGTVRVLGLPAPDPWIDPSYLTSPPSTRNPLDAGLYPAIVGSVLIVTLVAVASFVFGVGTAVFLEEYAPESGVLGSITRLLQVNIANLAAVPSIVYGLLGLSVFAGLLGFGFGTVATAAATLSLLILPITIISAQEAIRAVPDELRRGSDAMGATRWQTTRDVVLPEALPGILTGTILALGRAIGETAPLIAIGAFNTVFSAPNGIWSKASAMPLQIFAWADLPQPDFRYGVVAAGVVTLLIVLLGMNGTAIVLRNRSEGDV